MMIETLSISQLNLSVTPLTISNETYTATASSLLLEKFIFEAAVIHGNIRFLT
jgi:hypothetical protein